MERLLVAAILVCGCSPATTGESATPRASPTSSLLASATGDGETLSEIDPDAPPEAKHNRSARCRSCHVRQRDEWSLSAHAGAARGAYASALTHVPEAQRAECAGCHVPLSAASANIAEEGVACDACHTAVGPLAAPGALDLKPELATKFGPYKDSKDHNFHKVAYSEFVVGSSLCVSCHDDRGTRAFAVNTVAKEWRSGEKRGQSCQSCHMPTSKAKACKGGDIVRTVYAHDFGGKDKAAALNESVSLTVQVKDGVAHASVSHTAGHSLPTDLPERRMRLVLEALDDAGKTTARKDRVFGRTLVDGTGAAAPFFLAAKETKDDRIPEGAPRVHSLPITTNATRVRAQLWYEPWDPLFEKWYGAPPAPVLVKERVASTK